MICMFLCNCQVFIHLLTEFEIRSLWLLGAESGRLSLLLTSWLWALELILETSLIY